MIYLVLFAAVVFATGDDEEEPCPDFSSELICENCKCFGATKFNYKTDGADPDPKPIITRADCATAAYAAGATYYSWLRNGAELFCSFNTHKIHAHWKFDKMIDEPTESEVCEATQTNAAGHRTSGRDEETVKPWKIFKLNKNVENCACQIVRGTLVEAKKKCGGFKKLEHLKHNMTPTIAADKDACAKLAFQAGYTTFSYRSDKEWCMYGHYYSDDVACSAPLVAPTPENPFPDGWVETTSEFWGIYRAECAEEYYTYSMSVQGGVCTASAGVAFPKMATGVAYVACCPNVQHQQFTIGAEQCTRKDPTANTCFADGPKTYNEAETICKAAGLDLCPTDVAVSTCCSSDCAGNDVKYWTKSMVPVAGASTQA